MKVIIIEDEDISRNGLVHVIEKRHTNFKVVGEADNGVDGLNLIRRLKPDVVITDIKMPKLDGLKMLELAKNEGLSSVAVIISGYSDFELTQKAIRLGVKDYLRKPILVEEVDELLNRLYKSIIQEKDINEDDIINSIIEKDQYSFYVNKAIKYIQANYSKKISLEEIADEFKVTPGYLSLIFHKETSIKFSLFIKHYKINIAKKELMNGNDKVYEIAQKVGYDDPRYFCRVFKQVTGISATNLLK